LIDSRLNSVHLGFCPRREEYRLAREAVLDQVGWITWAAEQLHGALPDDLELPAILPEQVTASTRWLLLDRQTGTHYPLHVGLNTIGRMPNNDIVFGYNSVSRRHCVLLVHVGKGCELHDTASRNGTYVNGQRLHQSIWLRSGDLIQLPKQQLFFVSQQDGPEMLEADQTVFEDPAG
jgi:FHA domain